MNITVAKTAGFCFGVNRAVETVNRLLDEGESVWTLGPIIHNPQTLEDLASRGVRIAREPGEAAGGVLVIRSHGVSRAVLEEAQRCGVRVVDATCPFVAKIHRIVQQASREGRFVLIAGDREHPEVQGIVGHCEGECFVFSDAGELENFSKNRGDLCENPVCVVSQTTFSLAEWKNSLKIVKRVYTNAAIFDTICNATANRQSEAEALSRACDAMIIVGGRQSSNTAKLFDVCRKNCPSYFVEGREELPLDRLRGAEQIGITAGASTPASIIKEVLVTMTEIKENQEPNVMEDGASFEAMLEESLKSFNTDEKVRGVVIRIAPNEVYVDVGRKQAGFVPVDELSADPNVKPEDIVKVGDEIELLIMRTNDQEGTIMLSKKRLDAAKGWEAVTAASEDGTILDGTVTEILPKGGIIAVTHGVRVFIPASQATASRGEPLEGLLKKDVRFRIIEVNRGRRRAVGSIRSVLADERKALAEKFWETAEEGKEYTGTVKSLTSYGAFVDLGGIDGMIHISELSWDRIKHPSEVVNVGDTVSVYIKGLDREKGKISLGYKRQEDNPWEVLRRDYPVGSVVDATVVGMTTFGAFARIIPGIDGLIHISQIADHRIEKPQDVLKIGDVVKVKITEIDFEKKRVSLSIRALLEEQANGSEEAPVEE